MMTESVYDRLNKSNLLYKIKDGTYFRVWDSVTIPIVSKVWRYTIHNRIEQEIYKFYKRDKAWK